MSVFLSVPILIFSSISDGRILPDKIMVGLLSAAVEFVPLPREMGYRSIASHVYVVDRAASQD